jgi:hypothetical protein
VPAGTEVKWSPDKDSWLKDPEGRAVRTELRHRMPGLAGDVGATSIVVARDRGRLNWEVPRVRKKILRWLYDKVSTSCPAAASWDGPRGRTRRRPRRPGQVAARDAATVRRRRSSR